VIRSEYFDPQFFAVSAYGRLAADTLAPKLKEEGALQ
jgi:hypothetical protein